MRNRKDIRWRLGVIITVAFFAIVALLVYREMPAGNRELLLVVLGALVGAFTTVVGFYFGDSDGAEHNSEKV
jgi:uncharacterized BrkB/YihY/UPF0761 family membrane protein